MEIYKEMSKKLFSFFLKGTVLLLPLFFIPWRIANLGMDNYGKQNFLWILTGILLVLFILKTRKSGEFIFYKTKLELPLFFFFFLYLIAGIFGIDKFSSFWGQYGALGFPILSLICFSLLFYFILDFCRNKEDLFSLLSFFLAGYFISVLYSVLLFFNLGQGIFVSAFGSLNDFALYLSIIGIIIYRSFLPFSENFQLKKWQSYISRLAFLFSLILLLLINFRLPVIILVLGCLGVYSTKDFSFKKDLQKSSIWKRIKPNLVLIGKAEIALIFIIVLLFANSFILEKTGRNLQAQNLILDGTNSWTITKEAIKNRPFFGYGPETFGNVFSLYRPAGFNYSDFWNLRFNRPGSFVYEIIYGSGLLGIIFYLIFLLLGFYSAGKTFLKIKKGSSGLDKGVFAGIIFAWLGTVIIQFFYYYNTVLLFAFWFLLALIFACKKISEPGKEIIKIPIGKSVDYLLVTAFTCAALFIILTIYQIRFISADYLYKNGNVDLNTLNKVIGLDSNRSVYWVASSKLNIKYALDLIGNEGDVKGSEAFINQSIDSAKKAIEISPYSVIPEETLAVVYRELSPYANTTLAPGITAFEKAVQLEPTNPVLITELGKLREANGDSNGAVAEYEKALSLKNDYKEAQFFLGKAYEDKEEWDKALGYFQELIGEYNSSSLNYEIGRTYFNKKNYSEAIKYFQDVLSASPNNINAVYSIGLSFEAAKEYEQALFNYNKALKIDPNNQEIKDRAKKMEEEVAKIK